MLPEQRIWSAVIHRMLRDTLSEDKRIREEAIHWLTNTSSDLIMVCDLAEVNHRKVQSAARHLKELSPRAGSVYLSRLVDEERERTDD